MNRLRRLGRALVLAAILASPAASQCPPPAWISMDQTPGLAGPAFAMVNWDPDGSGPAPAVLAVGGNFTQAGSTFTSSVAVWDGTAFQSLGSGFDGQVFALTVYNGQLIAGGLFWMSGTVAVNRVAAWNGASWQPLGAGMDTSVRALTTYNGDLIAGGEFAMAGGVVANSVARWNGVAWSPLGAGIPWSSPFTPAVSALSVYNGNLVAGGSFNTAGGIAATNVATWDGTSWAPLGAGTTVVRALATYNGDLVTGSARWNGSSWSALGAGLSSGSVFSLATHNGELFIGGNFTVSTVTGVVSHIARWNGFAWAVTAPGLGPDVRALAEYGGGVVAGGSWFSFPAPGIARWNGSTWNALTGLNGSVAAMTASSEELIIGGGFTLAGGVEASNVARWNGSSWQALGPGLGPQAAAVEALAFYNGSLVAGGYFTASGGTAAARVARWNGSSWMPIGSGLSGPCLALTVYNNELIAGGAFSAAGGVAVSNIARWNGTSWQPLGAGVTGVVRGLGVYNGDLFLAEDVSVPPGFSSNIRRWNGASWQAPVAVSGVVSRFAVFGGELVAAGGYTAVGGVPFANVARWNGSVWQSLGTGVTNGGSPSGVSGLSVHLGELVVAGWFNMAGGVVASKIASWNGTSWQPLGAGLTSVPAVSGGVVLATYRGSLVAGGGLVTAGGVLSQSLARWSSPLPLLAISQPAGPGTGVHVTNRWLVSGHEYFNVVSADPAPGGPGSGPYGGLWFNNLSFLVQQLLLPVGTVPFHFFATGSETTFGPYALPAGFYFEALSGDVTGGAVGCLSPVTAFAVN